jgi:hypothetical protein
VFVGVSDCRNQQLKTSDINNLKLNDIIEECKIATIHFISVYTYDHIFNTHKLPDDGLDKPKHVITSNKINCTINNRVLTVTRIIN